MLLSEHHLAFLMEILGLTLITPPSLASATASCSWASLATIFFKIFFKFLLILPSTSAVDA